MINICFHIGNISNCGGTEKVTTQIADLLLKNYTNYNVTILSTYCDENSKPFFKGDKRIRYEKIYSKKKNNKINFLNTIYKIHSFIKKNDIDILISVDTILSLFDIPATKFTKCKCIAWEHFNFNYNLGVKLRDYGRKLAAKKADALVVLSNKDKTYFENNLNIKTKLIKIYNPFICNTEKEKYADVKKVIISVGRLTYQKGFDILLEVARVLKDKTKDFKWLILGEGEDRIALEDKIKEYNLQQNVELIGMVKNVKKYYKQSKFYVSTSRFEGLPLVLLEAKASGLPIISFDFDCGPSEMIKDGVNGYIIHDFDVSKMSDKIYDLLSNDDKCIEFSKNSSLDMEKFYPENIIIEWEKLIKEVIFK